MITLFTCPKPFTNKHTAIIQMNAIRSWTVLKPTPEIILLGKEDGVSDVASDLKLHHIPNIRYNERGIPILDSIFEKARVNARNKLLCYINSDIILMQDFMQVLATVNKTKDQFLIVSQRWDVSILQLLNFNSVDSINKTRLILEKGGKLHPPTGIDIHVSSSKLFKKISMLPFILGRGYYDMWLVWRARSLDIPVIDVTPMVKIFHQNHDYSHISARASSWKGSQNNPDSQWNNKLAGRWVFRYNINQASHLLTPEGLKYKFFHPFFEPFFISAKLFLELGIGELLNGVPSLKRAITQILRRNKSKIKFITKRSY